MTRKNYLLSSESVSEGHPDKMADQISDAVLDAHLSQDPSARIACETLLAKKLVVVAGEISSEAEVDIPDIVRKTIKDIGYTTQADGFDYRTCEIITSISGQSGHIKKGVKLPNGEVGAGDQGMMFGYATDEATELMPLGISLAHKLMQKQAELRKNGSLKWLRPDAKSQVTVRYEGTKPIAVEKIVFSTQHSQDVNVDQIRDGIIGEVIERTVPQELRAKDIKYFVNPTGSFEIGGPQADTGLTGRKIIVDTYGGSCPHGGGAFSGKDPTKVDRSAAYMARYIAKNIVAAGLSKRCTVQLAYAIGVSDPVSLMIDLQGGGNVDEKKLEDAVRQIFSLSAGGIIEMLDLYRPIYQKTSVYGHFGREIPEFTWEKTDKINALRDILNI
ncbi:methionine adenosyltransferase [Acidobacteriota bacterium]